MASLERVTRESSGFLGLVGFGIAAFALSGCGGSTIGQGDPGDDGGPTIHRDAQRNDPDCPAGKDVIEGSSCGESGQVCLTSGSIDSCGNTSQISCFCDGKSWICEQGVPVDDCTDSGPGSVCPAPSKIFPGNACDPTTVGACPSSQVNDLLCPDGSSNSAYCKCDGKWECTNGCTNPNPACPSASNVKPGAYCNANPSSTCQSSNVGFYDCSGNYKYAGLEPCTCSKNQWVCQTPATPPCLPPDPAVCPPADYVSSYASCRSPGLRCQGNPQSCGGDLYYDTLECEGTWIPIATTYCNAYGVDGGMPYPIYDAGTAF